MAPATATAEPAKEVGQARIRKEDARLITGQTTLDRQHGRCPGMLHIAVVRSPVAHAKITARRRRPPPRQAPGVVAVFTGADFAEEQGSLPCAWPVTAGHGHPGHPSVAVDEVNHVGEAVAVIVARSKPPRQDAAELVDVDYDPLARCSTWRRRSAEGATLVHDDLGTNEQLHLGLRRRRGRHRRHTDEAFAAAEADHSSSAAGSSSSG